MIRGKRSRLVVVPHGNVLDGDVGPAIGCCEQILGVGPVAEMLFEHESHASRRRGPCGPRR